MWALLRLGKVIGHLVRGPDGCSGGIRSDGGSNASAAGVMRKVLAWESSSGGCYEGDGEEGRW